MTNLKTATGGGRLFINPPYSKLDQVIDWVIEQAKNENYIFLLIPVRTDTRYFNKLINQLGSKIKIFFITGRLKFNESKNSAPFPSMFIEISEKPKKIMQCLFHVCTKDEFIELFKTILLRKEVLK